jgi:hypothetical protein
MKLDELASSLDEMWSTLADIEAKLDSIHKRLDNRDKHNVLMVHHVDRLVKEVEFYQRVLGLQSIKDRK